LRFQREEQKKNDSSEKNKKHWKTIKTEGENAIKNKMKGGACSNSRNNRRP
jgi:hypothetical protein